MSSSNASGSGEAPAQVAIEQVDASGSSDAGPPAVEVTPAPADSGDEGTSGGKSGGGRPKANSGIGAKFRMFRRYVKEQWGNTEPTHSENMHAAIDQLERHSAQYSELVAILGDMHAKMQGLAACHSRLGAVMRETGAHESEDLHLKMLHAAGIERELDGPTMAYVASLNAALDAKITFREKAVEDARDTLTRYDFARLDYESLVEAEKSWVDYKEKQEKKGKTIDQAKFDQAHADTEAQRVAMEAIEADFQEKLAVLDDMRVADMQYFISSYLSASKAYHKACESVISLDLPEGDPSRKRQSFIERPDGESSGESVEAGRV